MSLFSRFRRPAWQHADADRRAEAVRSDHSPELLAQLLALAANDPSVEVRKAAIARLDDGHSLLDLIRKEADAGCRAAAIHRLRGRLLDRQVDAQARLVWIAHPDLPNELLEAAVEAAPEAEARLAALMRLDRPAVTLRRCLQDSDHKLRMELLTWIDDEASLARIADQARKLDKTLAKAAKDKLDAKLLARGDGDAQRQRALALAAQLDQLARQVPTDMAARIEQIASELDALSTCLDEALQRRISGHLNAARDVATALASAHLPKPEPVAAPVETALETPAETEVEVVATITVDIAPVATEDRKPKPTPPDAALGKHLDEGLAGVRDQRLGLARPALDAAKARIAEGISASAGQREKLRELEAGVAEMERWQRWAGNKVRARLCDEVEAVIGSGLHPDAVANRIKQLQDEWAKVEASEPDHGEHATGIAKRFRAMCSKAMAPTREYFSQRHELRSAKATELAARGERVEAALNDSEVDFFALRKEVTDLLRELDDVEPRDRSRLGKQLRALLDRVQAARDAHDQHATEGKRALIERLRRDIGFASSQTAAIAACKQAQSQWKTLPRAGRKTEDTLWAELRAVIDPVFDKAREQQQAQQSELEAQAAARQAVLDELDTLAKADADALRQADSTLAELQTRWDALRPAQPTDAATETRGNRRQDDGRPTRPPRAPVDPLQRRFEQALDRVRDAQRALEQAREQRAVEALVQAVLSGEASDALSDSDRRALQQARTAGEATDTARELVALELAAGTDSPSSDAELRRELQMQRLAQRMAGARDDDARQWLLRWAGCATRADATQAARAEQALRKLLGLH
ncbi:MAG: DUF349 domain-containing protein [Xanthomonadales bacterium]|nr:DUF349 domain-containing protein [Xanthomonadales bacterium]